MTGISVLAATEDGYLWWLFCTILVAGMIAIVSGVRKGGAARKLRSEMQASARLISENRLEEAFAKLTSTFDVPCTADRKWVGSRPLLLSGVSGDAALKHSIKTLAVQTEALGHLHGIYERGNVKRALGLVAELRAIVTAQGNILGDKRLTSGVTGSRNAALVAEFAGMEARKETLRRSLPVPQAALSH